jgi:hypothetical protein
MRSFAILFTTLLLAGALYGQTAAPAAPAAGPEIAAAQPLPQPAVPEQPNLSPGFGFEYRSCSTERTACFNNCPQSGPGKAECFANCECQFIACLGGSCTQ